MEQFSASRPVRYPDKEMGLNLPEQARNPAFSAGFRLVVTLLLLAGAVSTPRGAGADRFQTSLCPTLAWGEQERIPIFDPLASPDARSSRELLGRLDTEIRDQVVDEMRKKGWRFVPRDEAACLMRYSLIQDLDLEVARRGSGGAIPGDPFGGSLPSTGTDSHMRKQGTFTLNVLAGDPEERIWQGTRKAPLGQGKEVDRNIRRLVREVLREVPRAR